MAKRKLLWLCLFSTGFALVVVILGAYTRLADAGLGCPDWPGCYGFLTVPDAEHEVARAAQRFPDAPLEQDKAWWEMIHRYFAGTLGLLILGIAAVAVVSARQRGSYSPPANGHSESAQRLPLKALGQALQLALWTYASIIFLSVLPCFGLRVLQEPSGDDLRALALLEDRGTRQVG